MAGGFYTLLSPPAFPWCRAGVSSAFPVTLTDLCPPGRCSQARRHPVWLPASSLPGNRCRRRSVWGTELVLRTGLCRRRAVWRFATSCRRTQRPSWLLTLRLGRRLVAILVVFFQNRGCQLPGVFDPEICQVFAPCCLHLFLVPLIL